MTPTFEETIAMMTLSRDQYVALENSAPKGSPARYAAGVSAKLYTDSINTLIALRGSEKDQAND